MNRSVRNALRFIRLLWRTWIKEPPGVHHPSRMQMNGEPQPAGLWDQYGFMMGMQVSATAAQVVASPTFNYRQVISPGLLANLTNDERNNALARLQQTGAQHLISAYRHQEDLLQRSRMEQNMLTQRLIGPPRGPASSSIFLDEAEPPPDEPGVA